MKYPFTVGIPGLPKYDFKKKDEHINEQIRYMLARTQSMFKYEGLPETIPQRILELYLQYNGFAGFYEHKEKLYTFFGGLGGEPDEYYMPTIFTIANPALDLSVNAKIDIDCVIVPNDSLYLGLIPLYNRYATALVENQLSSVIALINTRIISVIDAGDDRTKASADKFLKDVFDGKLGVVGSTEFWEGLKVHPYANTSGGQYLKSLIENEQYLKASWYNEIGINANYNMKHENINSAEVGLNDDALLPFVDDMLNCRKLGLEKVNAMFGTEISVSLASTWEDTQQEIEKALENLDDVSGQPEEQKDPDDDKEPEEMEEEENGDPETE